MDSSTFTYCFRLYKDFFLDCVSTVSFFVVVKYNCNDGNRQKALLPDTKERR